MIAPTDRAGPTCFSSSRSCGGCARTTAHISSSTKSLTSNLLHHRRNFRLKIERAERNDALETRFRDIDEQTKVVDVRGREGGNVDEYRETFTHYLRYGASRLNAQQQDLLAANDFATRAAAVGTGAAGGYTVPQGFWAKVTETLKFYAPMREMGELYTTDTGTVTNLMLAGSIAGSKLLDAGITYAKLQNLNYGEIIGRNTAGAGVSTGLSAAAAATLGHSWAHSGQT